MDLKKIAAEALDEMSLRMHDMHYHDGNYRGGTCLYRERLASGDKSDAALEDANEKEGIIHAGRRYEGALVERTFAGETNIWQKLGNRIQMLEPDKNGVSCLVVTVPANRFDSELSDDAALGRMFGSIGYDYLGKRRTTNGKKDIYEFDLFRPEKISFETGGKQNAESLKKDEPAPLDAKSKAAALRRYGMKIDDTGNVVPMTKEDSRKAKMRSYLGIVGDFEGQSNREDKESGIWEKNRLQMLKRIQDAKAAGKYDPTEFPMWK